MSVIQTQFSVVVMNEQGNVSPVITRAACAEDAAARVLAHHKSPGARIISVRPPVSGMDMNAGTGHGAYEYH